MLRRCGLWKSEWYCSNKCQKKNWPEHKGVCQAIPYLSETSNCKSKEFMPCVSHLTPSEHAKVVGLVGKKCMVKFLLNDYELDMLWDTGAQVSIISIQLLQQRFKDISIRQLPELLDSKLKFNSSEWVCDTLHWMGGS